MRLGGLIVLAAALVGARPGWSQVSVYGDFSATKLSNSAGTNFLFGPTVGASAVLAKPHWVDISGDFRGSFVGGAERYDSLVVGPRISRNYGKYTPYAEFMVGFARYNDGLGKPASGTTDGQFQGNGGIDRQMRKQIDWRVVDFSYAQFLGLTPDRFHPLTFSTGIVYRFGAR